MTVAEQNKLNEKAKTKLDGVYTLNNVFYAVKNGGIVAFIDYQGNIFKPYNSFNVSLGQCKRCERVKILKNYLKEIKNDKNY